MNLKLVSVLLLMLSANFFYNCTLFGDSFEQAYKMMFYAAFLFVVYFAYVKKRRKNNTTTLYRREQKVIDKCILFLLCGLFLSLLNSFFFKDQSLSVSLMTNIPMMIAYSSYFVFKKLNLTNTDERNVIIFMAVAYCMVFVLSFVTLPNPLFGTFDYEEMRGGFRLRIPGLFWVSLFFFYLIHKYKELRKISFLVGAFLLSLFVAASLARQYILWSAVLGLVFLMVNTKLRKKLLVVIFITLVGIFVVPEIPLVKNLKELSEIQKEQNDRGEDDIRVKDYQTFLVDYNRNLIQYIFGCGLGSLGNSNYGKELEYMIKDEGIIPEDVGWAGSVFYYGYYSTVILLFLFLYSILKTNKNYYKRFYLVYIALCAIAGGVLLYHYEVIITMFVLSNIFRKNQNFDTHRNVICYKHFEP